MILYLLSQSHEFVEQPPASHQCFLFVYNASSTHTSGEDTRPLSVHLRNKPTRITREECRQSHVAEPKPVQHDSLCPKRTSGMRSTAYNHPETLALGGFYFHIAIQLHRKGVVSVK